MNYILETDRLRLREFSIADTKFIVEILNSPGWLEFIGDRNVRTEKQAKAYLQNGPLKSYQQNGYGLSLVEKKDDHTAIGMCGIIRRDTLDHPDLGFALLPDYYGYGYAAEIASAVLSYAKEKLNISKMLAITLPANTRSIHLLEKIGFICAGTINLPNDKDELLLFRNVAD